MTIELPMWQGIVLMVSFFGAVVGASKVLFAQFETRMIERFKSQDLMLNQHMNQQATFAVKLQEMEKDMLLWRADLPMNYVRREDFIRNQTVIEAKLDAISSRVQNIQLKGNT